MSTVETNFTLDNGCSPARSASNTLRHVDGATIVYLREKHQRTWFQKGITEGQNERIAGELTAKGP